MSSDEAPQNGGVDLGHHHPQPPAPTYYGAAAVEVDAIAERLLRLLDTGATCEPISSEAPDFSARDAYAVLAAIGRRRGDSGWRRVGRKIGFTNRTIWEAYGVDRPFWADIWDSTRRVRVGRRGDRGAGVVRAAPHRARGGARAPGPVPVTDDPVAVLAAVEWMAPAFEVVRCPYPGWRFGIADCIAAAGLHGALVIGTRVRIDDVNRDTVAATLASFEATLSRNGELVDSGVGANVLDSPAHALGHLKGWSRSSRRAWSQGRRARHHRHDHERPPRTGGRALARGSTARSDSSRSP